MLEAMFAEANLGVFLVNKQGEIIVVNPYGAKLFGYEKTELIGQKVEELIPSSFRSKHTQHREDYHKKPTPRAMGLGLDLYGLKKDGEQFPIEISLSYTNLEGIPYAIAYVSDGSVQKNMLLEIRESKQMLEEAQRLANIGNFEMDFKTDTDRWSDEIFRIFELEVTNAMSHQMYLSHIHPDDLDIVKANHAKVKRDKEGSNFGYRIITTNKAIRYVEERSYVKLDGTGNVLKVFGLIQDVTDLKEAKNISEDISKIVKESLNEIYIFDAENLKFTIVNDGALNNIGYTLAEMKNLTPIDVKPEFEASKFLELLKPLVKQKNEKLRFETIHERKNKSTYPVEIHLQYSQIGLQPVFVAFVTDITKRKENEKKLKEYSEGLEEKIEERTKELKASEAKLIMALDKEKELGELKSRFVSMASHEFRTPLSSILSSANLIGRYEKEDQQDKRVKHINRIETAVKNLSIILNDFLSLEKLESGKVRHNPSQTDIGNYIQEVIEEVKPTLGKDQTIVYKHIGNDSVLVDVYLLKNVLLNLLSNGIKYSPEGKNVDLTTKLENKTFTIEIKDYGIGIPESDQKHLFTRFFRASNVTAIQGTGLGLTIIKRYLDLMGGEISFESKEGQGTTFIVAIPQ